MKIGLKLITGGPVVWSVFVSLAAAWAGYWLGHHRASGSAALPASMVPGLDYLTPPQSFSRVENTKSSLEALCVRLRLEIQGRIWTYRRSAAENGASEPGADRTLERLINDCEEVMREFEGTDQGLYLAQDLLSVLKMAGQFDRWTEVYLKALYQHPTHPVVARLAGEAMTIGRLAGQEQRVLAGLRHLSAIPIDFANNDGIKVSLNTTPASTRVALAGTAAPASAQ